MNARARSLIAALRSVIAVIPDASSIGIHGFTRWTYVLATVATDEAVRTLAAELELGGLEVRSANGQWWFRAISEEWPVRFEITGPHHIISTMEPPP